jgi:hypothetical protein
MRALLIGAVAALCLGATSVAAQELGSQSTGTVGIRVTIAPIGAAMAAAQDGADGLWSIQGGQGLMIAAPNTLESGKGGDLALFSERAQTLTVRPMSSNLTVTRGAYSSDRGLGRQAFRILAAPASADAHGSVLVIASL